MTEHCFVTCYLSDLIHKLLIIRCTKTDIVREQNRIHGKTDTVHIVVTINDRYSCIRLYGSTLILFYYLLPVLIIIINRIDP